MTENGFIKESLGGANNRRTNYKRDWRVDNKLKHIGFDDDYDSDDST
jgi:hypothetical protein